MTLREMQAQAHALRHSSAASATSVVISMRSPSGGRSVEQFDKATLAEELADIIIRVGDAASHWEIDLETAVVEKMRRNRERPVRHGGKRY